MAECDPCLYMVCTHVHAQADAQMVEPHGHATEHALSIAELSHSDYRSSCNCGHTMLLCLVATGVFCLLLRPIHPFVDRSVDRFVNPSI